MQALVWPASAASGGQTWALDDLVVDAVDQRAQREVEHDLVERTIQTFGLDIFECFIICADMFLGVRAARHNGHGKGMEVDLRNPVTFAHQSP